MSVTITIPADLEPQLRRAADAQHRTAEEVALDILRDGLRDESDSGNDLDLEGVVAAIRALPPNPLALRPGRGSLLEVLTDEPTDEPFDLAAWQREWAAVEEEMAATTRADDRAEGRA